VILGGRGKDEPYEPLAEAFKEGDRAYLVGEAAEPLATDLGYAGVPFRHCGTIERAVAEAARAAQPGDVVLLSPACASWDQYPNFEARGDHFRRLVLALDGKGAA
jgi:UDP-N-acetylmuramoylalanine--D-glutamate ligase